MPPPASTASKFIHLECVRGLAALAVFAGHLRATLFDSFGAGSVGGLSKAFYFLTGLGHQAVMVFFVLSGFFITKSIDLAHTQNRWSWKEYLTSRLTRLWMVLLPCLLLTYLWDCLGRSLGDSGLYAGVHRETLALGPSIAEPADLSFLCLLGNIFFLQQISVPVYGSNGPLWSLAYEFWYYIFFPLAVSLFYQPKRTSSLLSFVGAVAIAVLLPAEIRWGGVIWLMGAAVYYMSKRLPSLSSAGRPMFFWPTLGLFMGSLVAARFKLLPGPDLMVGLAFSLVLPSLMARPPGPSLYVRMSSFLSDISYTLYLAHFPVLMVGFSLFLGLGRLPFSVSNLLWYAVVFFGVFAYSFAVWWLFERNTAKVRYRLRKNFA